MKLVVLIRKIFPLLHKTVININDNIWLYSMFGVQKHYSVISCKKYAVMYIVTNILCYKL